MNNPTVQNTPGLMFRSLQRPPALGLVNLPSFARALRQRGLIESESWIPVLSIYEAHLRRQAMEQAFAALRGDPV